MNYFQRGTIKYLIALIVTTALFGMIIYPLLDFIICKFFTHSEFKYLVFNHIVQPVLFGCIYGVTYWSIDKKRK